ncbi:ATP-dependent endonuclease [Levilactobacillus lanxiensis]|uniref:ATP-dependent endonuclease n=1 Tax=Levilactobacillus lanxiensis TaxID=2799568 RepID=A0ABW4D2V8_9LACO|nr:AAA family ATPase [Levilactobacillus lanxiensis]
MEQSFFKLIGVVNVYLKRVKITNYRMLSDVDMTFDLNVNYLVGRNNIGKTSTLDMIETILEGKNFQSSDFSNPESPIVVDMTFLLSDDELGVFGDNFSPENKNEVVLTCTQLFPDDRIEFIHKDTESDISVVQIKRANYVGYSSNVKPVKENDLTANYGKYKLIPLLVNSYISSSNEKDNKITESPHEKELIDFINKNLHRIKPFEENEVSVGVGSDYSEYITRALTVTDNEGIGFSNLGYGTQFSSLISLRIIDQIFNWSRYGKLDTHIVENTSGQHILNVILCLDEPDVHLHPNLQVKLMKQVQKMLKGEDNGFNELLKTLFNIDVISGQLFVVTHSPNVVAGDFTKICRFTRRLGDVEVASGSLINLNPKELKMVQQQMANIKDALFADAVIIVEGYTEVGAIPVLADNIGKSLIDFNVDVIGAGSVTAVPALTKVLSYLKIKSVSIIDSDGKDRQMKVENLFITDKSDFEDECWSSITLDELNNYFGDFELYIKGNEYTGSYWDRTFGDDYKQQRLIPETNISELVEKFLRNLSSDERAKIKENIREDVIKKYFKDKSTLNGRLIAENISLTPDVYQRAIEVAIKDE